MTRQAFTLVLLTLLGSAPVAAQDPPITIPTFKSGDKPVYPSIPQSARIQGTVKLEVRTNGDKVTEVKILSGQPMLAKAAQELVKSWSFEHHDPTAFPATVVYRLMDRDCTQPYMESVEADFPSKIEIAAPTQRYCEEDLIDRSEPLRVFFSGCEFDEKPIPCDGVSVELIAANSRVVPKRFKEPNGREGFVVPSDMRTLKEFGTAIKLRNKTFEVSGLHGGFLKGTWTIGIRHKRERLLRNKCIGYISFDWLEPGRSVSTDCR